MVSIWQQIQNLQGIFSWKVGKQGKRRQRQADVWAEEAEGNRELWTHSVCPSGIQTCQIRSQVSLKNMQSCISHWQVKHTAYPRCEHSLRAESFRMLHAHLVHDNFGIIYISPKRLIEVCIEYSASKTQVAQMLHETPFCSIQAEIDYLSSVNLMQLWLTARCLV